MNKNFLHNFKSQFKKLNLLEKHHNAKANKNQIDNEFYIKDKCL